MKGRDPVKHTVSGFMLSETTNIVFGTDCYHDVTGASHEQVVFHPSMCMLCTSNTTIIHPIFYTDRSRSLCQHLSSGYEDKDGSEA